MISGIDCMTDCKKTSWHCINTTTAPPIKCTEAKIKQIKSQEIITIGPSSMEQEISFLLSKCWVVIPLINDSPSIMRHYNFVPTAHYNTAHYNTEGAVDTLKPSHVLQFLFHSQHEISRLRSLVLLMLRFLRTSTEGSCPLSFIYN